MIGAVALAMFTAAVVLGWCAGIGPAGPGGTRSAWSRAGAQASWAACAVGATLLVVAGARAVAGSSETTTLPLTTIGGAAGTLQVDALSGMFLVIAFGVAVPATVAGIALAIDKPRLGAVAGLILLAMHLVIAGDGLFTFLFGWELLTLAFFLAIAHDRTTPGTGRAAMVAVAFGKLSGAALLLGGLLAAGSAASLQLADLGAAHGAPRHIAYALLVLGFGIKAGLVPVHVWLPRGYAAAPAPLRAVMGGAAVNVGFYGLWRTLHVLGAPPGWLVVVVLLLAGASAVIGIAHAAVHADLRFLIAWSSVENAGVISAGYAAALVGAAAGAPPLVAAGLLAATAQAIAHALGKSTLFVSAAAVEQAWHSTDLDRLHGIARRLPVAGTGLLIGSLTLAGLPFTAGLAGEWLTLEALMQQFRVGNLAMQLAMATAGALVALSVGIAGFTFVRLAGLTVFGRSPRGPAGTGRDRSAAVGIGVVTLGAGCLLAAVFAPAEIAFIAHGLSPIVDTTAAQALAGGWVLQPVYPGFSALSPSWLWIVIPVLTILVAAVATALSGARGWKARTVPAWSSGSPGVDRGTGYTSFGYANPVRTVLANLLRTRRRLDAATDAVDGRPSQRRDGPDGTEDAPLPQYTIDVVEIVEDHLYRPAQRVLLAAATRIMRLQSGRLDAYLAYMLIALIAVLVVVTAIG